MLEATLQSSFVLLQSFETRFHSADQCGLQVLILLPQFPSAQIIDVPPPIVGLFLQLQYNSVLFTWFDR